MYPVGSSISWICRESTMSPSFSISVPDDCRVSWVSFSRSRIISSTVMLPTIARRWPAKTLWTRASIWSCWSRNRRAALAIDVRSSPTLKMTTPRIPRGMPWWVTQSIDSSDSRRSSERRRTVCTPGTMNVPLPVVILNPRLSDTASLGVCSRSPETMRASLGSATRHIILNRMMKRTTAPTTTPAMNPADMAASLEAKASHAGDDHRARREVLHDNDAAPDGDRLVVVGGVGVEGLAPPTHLHHHFTQLAGGDRPGGPTHLADHPVVGP